MTVILPALQVLACILSTEYVLATKINPKIASIAFEWLTSDQLTHFGVIIVVITTLNHSTVHTRKSRTAIGNLAVYIYY